MTYKTVQIDYDFDEKLGAFLSGDHHDSGRNTTLQEYNGYFSPQDTKRKGHNIPLKEASDDWLRVDAELQLIQFFQYQHAIKD